jgi:tryptophan synthase alpha chain
MERKRYLNEHTSGFMYTVARKGVTGKDTKFGDELGDYLAECRQATDLPLALGFGVKTKADYEYIRGKADVAIIGSEAIRVMEDDGVEAVGPFIKSILA